jgi:hypothetical protein
MMPPLATVLVALTAATAVGGVHHDLEVRLDLEAHRIEVRDHLTVNGAVASGPDRSVRFVLHADLEPSVASSGWTLERSAEDADGAFLGLNASSAATPKVPVTGWELRHEAADGAEAPAASVEILYRGEIHHPLEVSGEEYQRSFTETPGLIGENGVFLAGTSFWVPTLGEDLVTFELTVTHLPDGFGVVSQGERVQRDTDTGTTTWRCQSPTEEIYLVAGPWTEYRRQAGDTTLYAFLRTPDPSLASRYLEASERYLKMYERALPPYPYPSFAVVENFWETGYGMPGFTLLGEKILRFPWILTSSYPHEILHSWWGNSVYVDYASGNWCEGLTAYMADHTLAEHRGEARAHRRTTLQKYADFVRDGEDLPISQFRSRHSAASEAVGYGKGLMIFHMLRRAVGEHAFLDALHGFANEHMFSRASLADVAAAFAHLSEGPHDWAAFYDEWSHRSGAPSLELVVAFVRRKLDTDGMWSVEVQLRQTQEARPFPLLVPLAITVKGLDEPVLHHVWMTRRRVRTTIDCPGQPLRLDVDPAFDLMRRIDPMEVPPALSTVQGSETPVYVLPTAASDAEREAWRRLAQAWHGPDGSPRIVADSEFDDLPDGAVWLLGAGNAHAETLLELLADRGVERHGSTVTVGEQQVGPEGSVVLVERSPGAPEDALAWVAAPIAAIEGLTRKLPHYSKYSWLTFSGDDPSNTGKGMWQATDSPLVRQLSPEPMPELKLPPGPPLLELPAAFDAETMLSAVETLAGEDMAGRGLGSEGLDAATDWVEQRLASSGLEPAGDDGYRQSWSWRSRELGETMHLTNLVARVPGTDPALAHEPVLVMAHVDHLGYGWPDVRSGNEGQLHPGADDNASGVAVLLALSRALADAPAARPVLLAVVTGEEAGRIGSTHLLDSLAPAHLPFACINLDTVGRLADGTLYALNADSAREWRFIFMGVGYTVGTEVALVTEPLDASDQVSCLEHGVPAVQLFTGPTADYHRPSDTADTVDAEGMAAVAEVAHEVITYLAQRTEPLTVTIAERPSAKREPASADAQERRASLGTMPDFAFAGPGVKVAAITPGSAAAAAGIEAGDVLRALNGEPIADLRGLAGLLRQHAPGDEVAVTLNRNDTKLSIQVTLGER